MRKTLFLDRDWVINKKAPEGEYVYSLDKFQRNDKAQELIRLCKENFWLVIVVTNQQGIWKGLYSYNDVEKIHDKIQYDLWVHKIDGFFVCPHLIMDNCACRKPKPGMIYNALDKFSSIDKQSALLIGDSTTDIEAAKAAGIKSIKIDSDWLSEHFEYICTMLKI